MKTFTCRCKYRLLVQGGLAPRSWRVSKIRILCWPRTFAATAIVNHGRSGTTRTSGNGHSAEIYFTGDSVDAAGNRRAVEEGIEGGVPQTAIGSESVGADTPHLPS